MGKNSYFDAHTIHCILRQPLPDSGGDLQLTVDSFLTPYLGKIPLSFSYLEPVVVNSSRFWNYHEFVFCENSLDCSLAISAINSRSLDDWLKRVDDLKTFYARGLCLEDRDGSSES